MTPGDVVSHRSAALLLNLPRNGDIGFAEVSHPERARSANARARARRAAATGGRPSVRTSLFDVQRHRRPLPSEHTERYRIVVRGEVVEPGLIVTTSARTTVDLMMSADPVEAMMAADAYLAHEALGATALITVPTLEPQREEVISVRREELAAVFECLPRSRGAEQFRRILTWASGLAASPLESHTAYVLRVLGIEFEQQYELFDRAGRFIGRTDFFLLEYGLALEVDGRSKYIRTDGTVDPDKVEAEKARNDAFVRAGYRTLRVGWSHVRQPHRLRAALRDMGVVV